MLILISKKKKYILKKKIIKNKINIKLFENLTLKNTIMKRSLVNSRILEGQGHSNKVLPSSNPIRNPSPDLLSRKERINYTQSPSTYNLNFIFLTIINLLKN